MANFSLMTMERKSCELTTNDIKACLAYAADREHKLQHA